MPEYPNYGSKFLSFAKQCSDPCKLFEIYSEGKIDLNKQSEWPLGLLQVICDNNSSIDLIKDAFIYVKENKKRYLSAGPKILIDMIVKSESVNVKANYVELAIDLIENNIVHTSQMFRASIVHNCDEIVEYFVTNSDWYSSLGRNAVLEAVKNGKTSYVKMLIDHLGYHNDLDCYKASLEAACIDKHIGIIEYLWQNGYHAYTKELALLLLHSDSIKHLSWYDSDEPEIEWNILNILLKYESTLCQDPEIAEYLIFYEHEIVSQISSSIKDSINANNFVSLAFKGYIEMSHAMQLLTRSDIVPSVETINTMLIRKMFDEVKAVMNRLDTESIKSIYQTSICYSCIPMLEHIDTFPEFDNKPFRNKMLAEVTRYDLKITVVDYFHKIQPFTQSELNAMLSALVKRIGNNDIKLLAYRLLDLGADISIDNYAVLQYACQNRRNAEINAIIHHVKDDEIIRQYDRKYNLSSLSGELIHRDICATNTLLKKAAAEYVVAHEKVPENIPSELRGEVALRLLEKSLCKYGEENLGKFPPEDSDDDIKGQRERWLRTINFSSGEDDEYTPKFRRKLDDEIILSSDEEIDEEIIEQSDEDENDDDDFLVNSKQQAQYLAKYTRSAKYW